MTVLLPLLTLVADKTYVDYRTDVPPGWTRKTEKVLAEGANEVNRLRMEFRPKGSSRSRGEGSITTISHHRPVVFANAVRDEVQKCREFGKLGEPVRVAPLTTADGRSVRVYVFPKGVGDGYQRLGFVQLPGGYAMFQLTAPSGAGRRLGDPAFNYVIGSFRHVP